MAKNSAPRRFFCATRRAGFERANEMSTPGAKRQEPTRVRPRRHEVGSRAEASAKAIPLSPPSLSPFNLLLEENHFSFLGCYDTRIRSKDEETIDVDNIIFFVYSNEVVTKLSLKGQRARLRHVSIRRG